MNTEASGGKTTGVSHRPSVSAVSPVYNRAASLRDLVDRLSTVLGRCSTAFEIILVNDGSQDDSWGEIHRLAEERSQVRGLDLSRNFGQHHAVLAGIRAARNEVIVTIMVAVPNVDALINLTADLLHRLVGRRAEPILSRLYTYPQHINYFSGATLMRLFRGTGSQPSIVRQHSRSHEVAHLPLPARWGAGALLTLGRMVGRGNKLLLFGRKQHAHSDTPSGVNS